MTKYAYKIMTVGDVGINDTIFVPNASAGEAVEIWRWLSGLTSDFPEYKDGSNTVAGIEEDAWCDPFVYLEAYCPLDMVCIVRASI